MSQRSRINVDGRDGGNSICKRMYEKKPVSRLYSDVLIIRYREVFQLFILPTAQLTNDLALAAAAFRPSVVPLSG
jgi:hypothetical protein